MSTDKEARVDVMRLLLEMGADPNDKEAYIPLLLHAVGNNMEEAVELLCTFGADVNAIDHQGKTALHDACSNERSCLKILLRHGADPNKCDDKGLVPFMDLFCGFIHSPNAIVAKWLIAFGADPFAANKNGKTVRQYARRKLRKGGDEDAIREIIELLDDVETLGAYAGVMARQPKSANDCFVRASCCMNWLEDEPMAVNELVTAVTIEPDGISRVLEGLESDSWRVRFCAVSALAQIEDSAEIIVPALVQRLEDADMDVSAATAAALTKLGFDVFERLMSVIATSPGQTAVQAAHLALEIDERHADFVLDQLRQRAKDEGCLEGGPAFEAAQIHGIIALIQQDRDNVEEAIAEFEKSVQLNPSLQSGYWVELAQLQAKLGDSSLEDAIRHYEFGQCAHNEGRFEEAREGYRRAINASRDFPWGLNNLAWLFATCRDRGFRDGKSAGDFSKSGG